MKFFEREKETKNPKNQPKNRIQRAFWDIKTITTFIDLLIIYQKCITTITMDDTIEYFIYIQFFKKSRSQFMVECKIFHSHSLKKLD
jgi:hypothetical protein